MTANSNSSNNDTIVGYAIRRLIRLPDGTMGSAFFDAETGERLFDLTGYTILTSGNLLDPNDATNNDSVSNEEQQTDGNLERGSSGGGGGNSGYPGGAPEWYNTPLSGMIEGIANTLGINLSRPQYPAAPSQNDPFQPATPAQESPVVVGPQSPRQVMPTEPDYGFSSQGPNFPGTAPTSSVDRGPLPDVVMANNGIRNQAPDASTVSLMREAVNSVLGPNATITVTSGAQNSLGVGGPRIGSTRHDANQVGGAIDVAVSVNGQRVTDPATLEKIQVEAARRGALGIGYGPGYMGPGMMHIDQLVPSESVIGQSQVPGGFTWAGETGNPFADVLEPIQQTRVPAYQQEFQDNVRQAAQQFNLQAIVNTNNMSPDEQQDFFQNAQRNNVQLAQNDDGTITATIDPYAMEDKELGTTAQRVIETVTKNPKFKEGLDITKMSPAELSSTGYGLVRTPEEQRQISYALAGELDPKTLEGLIKNDPVARQELANMIATIENRAQSTLNPSQTLEDILTPSKYNSLMESSLPTTTFNYQQYGSVLDQAVKDFYTGANPPSIGNATHYANLNIVDPRWADYAMGGMQPLGEHSFGQIAIPGTSIAEYRPGGAFQNTLSTAIDDYGRDSINVGGTSPFGPGSLASQSLTSSGPDFGYSGSNSSSVNSGGPGFRDSGSSGSSSYASGGNRDYVGGSSSYGPSGSYGAGSSGSNSITSSPPSFSGGSYVGGNSSYGPSGSYGAGGPGSRSITSSPPSLSGSSSSSSSSSSTNSSSGVDLSGWDGW